MCDCNLSGSRIKKKLVNEICFYLHKYTSLACAVISDLALNIHVLIHQYYMSLKIIHVHVVKIPRVQILTILYYNNCNSLDFLQHTIQLLS